MTAGNKRALIEIDATNWRLALDVRVADDELRFVADHQPVSLVILAKAAVHEAGLTWTPLALASDGPDGDIVAVLALAYLDQSPTAHLSHLAVDTRARRRGLATTAVAGALDWARQNLPLCRFVDLTVHPQNHPAIALYSSLGFAPTGAERHGEPVWQSPPLRSIDHIADTWIRSALNRAAAGPVTSIEVHRHQPWSTVAEVSTEHGRYWFKESYPAFHHETTIMERLAKIVPDHVLTPIALDHERGWLLLPDGGPEATGTSDVDLAARYADVQLASASIVAELLAGGVPDRRPEHMPKVFRELQKHADSDSLRDRCDALASAVHGWCEELASDGLAALVNGDFGSSHTFLGPPLRIYDWGDSVIGHPFMSAGIIPYNAKLEGTAYELGLAAFVGPWGAHVNDRRVHIGLALSCLINADVWMRGPEEARIRYPDHVSLWLTRFVDRAERLESATSGRTSGKA